MTPAMAARNVRHRAIMRDLWAQGRYASVVWTHKPGPKPIEWTPGMIAAHYDGVARGDSQERIAERIGVAALTYRRWRVRTGV